MILTRFWLNSATRQIASTTRIELGRAPRVITELAYPNILFPLRIISKTNIRLTVEQITAEADFEGLYAGTILWVGDHDKTIEKKQDKEIIIEFAPPLQVFLLNLSKCHLRNGIAKVKCSLGEVVVPFFTESKGIDSFERGAETVRGLLRPN